MILRFTKSIKLIDVETVFIKKFYIHKSVSVKNRFGSWPTFFCRNYCSDSTNEDDSRKGGFAKAYDKFSTQGSDSQLMETEPSFLSLLKNSKFVDLGDPEGKVVTGTIFHVVEDDLYVDFGWKFHCVVPRPAKNGHEYVRGAKVRLSIKDLELSSRFLGSQKDLTLLEADAILLGLVSSPARAKLTKNQ